MSDGELGRSASDEERWLHEANAEAAVFYRQELLRTSVTWPAELLRDWGVGAALELGSVWQIGYAPDRGTRLTDHLQDKGFTGETLRRAGLTRWTNDGGMMDRYQDRVVLVSRDRRLDPVGFLGIDRDGQARTITPQTLVHDSSNALVGVLEQIDALEAGAAAVIVDHPLDAIAIDLAVRHSGDRGYAGIPLIESAVSEAQAQVLRQYSRTSRVIVTVPDDLVAGGRAIRYAVGLTPTFDVVRLIERPTGSLLTNPGALSLLTDIVAAEPENGRRDGPKDDGSEYPFSPNIEDSGPTL